MSGPPEPVLGQDGTKVRVPTRPRRTGRLLQIAHFIENHMEARVKHLTAESMRPQLPHAAASPGISHTLLFFPLKRLETGQPGERRQLESRQ